MNKWINEQTNEWTNNNSSDTTNFTEQGPRENASFLVEHKVTHPVWNLKVPNYFHKSTPLNPILF